MIGPQRLQLAQHPNCVQQRNPSVSLQSSYHTIPLLALERESWQIHEALFAGVKLGSTMAAVSVCPHLSRTR